MTVPNAANLLFVPALKPDAHELPLSFRQCLLQSAYLRLSIPRRQRRNHCCEWPATAIHGCEGSTLAHLFYPFSPFNPAQLLVRL